MLLCIRGRREIFLTDAVTAPSSPISFVPAETEQRLLLLEKPALAEDWPRGARPAAPSPSHRSPRLGPGAFGRVEERNRRGGKEGGGGRAVTGPPGTHWFPFVRYTN
uniref:Uncharacterized protein H1.01 n=1 Tax=Gallus gallus TaxID=9031 RepID=Q7LZ59_CHICK|nr:histone H1 [Gallus gallus]